jgi:hypothetical protein
LNNYELWASSGEELLVRTRKKKIVIINTIKKIYVPLRNAGIDIHEAGGVPLGVEVSVQGLVLRG